MTDNKEIVQLLSEDVRLQKFIFFLKEIFDKTLEIFLTDILMIESKAERDFLKTFLITKGLPFKIETKNGDIEGFLKLKKAIYDAIFNYLGILCLPDEKNLLDENPKDITLEQILSGKKDFVAKVSALHLHFIIINFKDEIPDTLESLVKISQLDVGYHLDTTASSNYTGAIERLLKYSNQKKKEKRGIKRGGLRHHNGFCWNNDRKVEFYKAVESIPKITRRRNGKKESIYIWDYIYEQFDSRGMEAKELLKSEPNYKLIPEHLLKEAFKKWQSCEENYQNVKMEDTPKMFLFRHVLQILNFPEGNFFKNKNEFNKYKKSTLQKYYDEGRKIAGAENQNAF